MDYEYILGFIPFAIISMPILFIIELVRRNRLRSDVTTTTTSELYTTQIRPHQLAFLEQDDAEASLVEIGCGGSATVYKARLLETAMPVAIKKILLDDTTKDYRHLLHQLEAETDIGKRIRHRNVVPLLARVSTPRCVYLVFENIRNGSLRKVLRDEHRVLDWPYKCKIALGVAKGLEYLHYGVSPNVIHRDLKPDNILLDRDMEARIADFGLATSIPETEAFLIMPDTNGTVGYMDREYFDSRVLRRSSDVYSFGIILAELLTLRSPTSFTGDATLVQLITDMRNLSFYPERIRLFQSIGPRYIDQGIGVLELAYLCTRPLSRDRPNTIEVRKMLEDYICPD